jgi:serine protease Do
MTHSTVSFTTGSASSPQRPSGRIRSHATAFVAAVLNRRTTGMAALWLVAFVLARTVVAEDLGALEQQAVRASTRAVADSVVAIETLGGLESVGGALVSSAPTTGLVVGAEGWIVSSAVNFIQQPASILVILPGGERRPARIVARDRSRMLVLLKVETDRELPVPATLDRSQLRVGQTVVALGRTFDPAQVNLSVGILSATERIWGKAIQTDANVSPANYGGPLIDLQGRVLGVLVPLSPEGDNEVAGSEWYDSGIGFAIPLTDILARLETLQAGTDLKPGLFGFAFRDSKRLDASPELGVVKANSPAAEAGLKPGDRFVSLNDVPITLQSHAMHVLKPLYAGDRLRFVADRQGETIRGEATLVERLVPYEHAFLGIGPSHRVRNAAQDAAQPTRTGVFVREVFTGSAAEKAGVRPGDRIIRGDDVELADGEALRSFLANRQPGDAFQLHWRRGEEALQAEVILGSLPTDLAVATTDPTEEPDAAAPAVAAEKPPETGRLEWKVPEEPNQGIAFVPTNYDPRNTYGVLVLVLPPGQQDLGAVIEPWKSVCESQGLILIVPQPEDATRWSPTEAAFLRKAVEQAQRRYAVDPQRIVVLGREAGGAMAVFSAFRHRDTFRGLVIEDAAIPPGIGLPDNEPLQRLAVLMSLPKDSPLRQPMEAAATALREQKFPVTTIDHAEKTSAWEGDARDSLARWINSLDRM